MKRKGMLIGTLVFSVGGLVIDQVFLKSGGPAPAAASPDTLMAMGAEAFGGPALPKQPKAANGPDHSLVRGLVAKLGTSDAPQGGIADVFAQELFSDAASLESVEPLPAEPAADVPVLSAVLVGTHRHAAIINGRVYRAGETFGGIRLLDVTPGTATVESSFGVIELSLQR
jgi:hypothetical protein